MNNFKKLLIVAAILIFAGVLTQTFRIMYFSKFIDIEQSLPEIKVEYVSETSIPKDTYKILVLAEKNGETDRMILNNVVKTFDNGKLNYEVLLMEEIENKEFDEFNMLVVATEDYSNFSQYEELSKFLTEGGALVLLTRTFDQEINSISGIDSNYKFINDIGIVFRERIFPGLADMEIGELLDHSLLDVRLKDDIEIVATTKNNKPLIWVRNMGKGRVVYVNSSILEDKLNRGLLLQTVGLGSNTFLSTIYNSKLFYIDDFPAPMKPGSDPVVEKYYGVSNRNFYKHIWWSAMYNLAKKYDLKYTGVMIGLYNQDVNPPFENFNREDIKDFEYFGRKLIEIGGEIGIHGYNHNSLGIDGEIDFEEYDYRSWKTVGNMEKSLEKLQKLIAKIFGDIRIYTYVPPSNLLPASGKEAVFSSLKDIKVLGGVFYGDKSQKGLLMQEFGEDPDYRGVYAVPRISSGYLYNKVKMWEIYNAIAHLGFFNHFIHPDDLLDYERSGNLNWEKLYGELEKIISEVHNNHFYLRGMTSMEFVEYFEKYLKLKVFWKREGNLISVYYENYTEPVYHLLKLKNERIKDVQNGSFAQFYKEKDIRFYLIKGENKKIGIELL
ncbi:MAG: DUF2194 domain-containing protein [Candidatus Mcinerneyibacterium aminivorans]|uniref:DUF2194 domain-containing protein n=1 Tax=Candidatus Mcinerneyibacterium aminivorans TaxID=2703815 RepID=A0A5D0MIM3_9BACT|nr:MAG: DUF2194 domain-containing protein [Candidatus Mcinerneyibacterium aminivorans]